MDKMTLLIEQLRNLGQAGIYYTKDSFDKERYEQLLALTKELAQQTSKDSLEEIQHYLFHDSGYITPKIDIRAFVMNEKQQILMVQEITDQCWSLPGGWADIGYSPKEIAEKEVWEETGLTVKAERLLGLYDKDKHPFKNVSRFYTYKAMILCRPLTNELKTSNETINVRYFTMDEIRELPLSTERILLPMVEEAYEQVTTQTFQVYCD